MPHVAGLIFADGQFSKLVFLRKDAFWVLPGGPVPDPESAFATLSVLAASQIGVPVRLQGRPDQPIARHGDTSYFQGLLHGKQVKSAEMISLGRVDIGSKFRPAHIYEADRQTLQQLYGWPF